MPPQSLTNQLRLVLLLIMSSSAKARSHNRLVRCSSHTSWISSVLTKHPDADWTARVGKVLGMTYSFVGKISSANHKDKYKTILSRTPLEGTEEYKLTGIGWNPASVVRATTKIDGISFAFYSLHICKSGATNGHAYGLATKVLPKEITERVIVVGDFNNNIGDAAINTVEGAGFRSTWTDLKIDVSKEFTYNAQNPKKISELSITSFTTPRPAPSQQTEVSSN